MKKYDTIVVGSGSGMEFVDKALSHEESVALVDKGPLGGTCLNLGCIPSKMLIFPADRIMQIRESKKLGIDVEISNIDFKSIMERMKDTISKDREGMEKGIQNNKDIDYYDEKGEFVDDYTLKLESGKKIKGKKIFLVSGSRPLIPKIKGIKDVEYLTNETLLELKEKPESLIIVGGGYIAAEYGHFFDAMGTEVTILQRNEKIIPNEEPEISDMLKKQMKERMSIETNMEVIEVKKENDEIIVFGKDTEINEEKKFKAKKVMIATGRRSNADLLKVENTGVDTDKRGFIKVNDKWETSKENIWALGDATGKQMFKHKANREAAFCAQNVYHGKEKTINYDTTPHAIFSHPQIASVGLKEKEAKEKYGKEEILVGGAEYLDVAKGEAMMEDCGFVKTVLNKRGKILGFHIIGPHAPILIQEVVNVIAKSGDIWDVSDGMHIHPALSELVLSALQPKQRETLKTKFVCKERGNEP